MMHDVTNYKHYRLTSHGGRKHDLFNREADTVISLTAKQYNAIRQSADPVQACVDTEAGGEVLTFG